MPSLARLAAAAALCLAASACNPSSPAPVACSAPKAICTSSSGAAQCLDLSSDTANCGGCGIACANPAGGAATCSAGRCAYACTGATSRICDAVQSSGDGGVTLACTDTATDPRNCGACGTLCASDQVCTAGACVAGALSQCGVDSSGGVVYKDLDSDRANCGACGTACGSTEICEGGRCTPCGVAQCGNVCVDTQRDPNNCGACGNVAPGGGTCENGAVLAKIALVPDPVLATGEAPTTLFTVTMTVHSGLRVQNVFVETGGPTPYPGIAVTSFPDGGTSGTSAQALALFSGDAPEVSPSRWTITLGGLPANSSGELTFTAVDEKWLPGDPVNGPHAAQYAITLSGVLTTTKPPLTLAAPALAIGATALAGNAWLPLNASPVTMTSTLTGSFVGAGRVSFFSSVSGQPIAAAIAGGVASATVPVASLGYGTTNISACAYDFAGIQLACSPSVSIIVGAVSNNFSSVVLARGVDGTHTLWVAGPSGGSGVPIAQPYNQVTSAGQPGPLLAGADSLYGVVATPGATGILGIKSNATAIERFDCPSTTATCWKPAFVTAPAGVSLGSILAVNSTSLVALANSGYVFAPALASQTSAPGVAGGQRSVLLPVVSTASGLLAVAATATVPGSVPTLEIELFHPRLPADHLVTIDVGAQPASAAAAQVDTLYGGPGGTLVWTGYDEFGNRLLDAAFFDGTNPLVALQTPRLTALSGGQRIAPPSTFLEVTPGRVLGAWAELGADLELVEIDLTPGATQVSVPSPADAAGTSNVLVPGVGDRYGNPTNFAISDDKAKAIYVTRDATTNPNVTLYTLHLLDLATGLAQSLYASPTLMSASPRPQFVHQAASYTGGALAASGPTDVVAWAEPEEPGAGGGTVTVGTIRYATYAANTAAAKVTQVDRQAVLSFQGLQDPIVFSAAANAVLFLSPGATPNADLCAASFTGTGGVQAATRLLPQVFSFAVREDTRRLAANRSDGAIFAGPLTSGAALASGLVQVAQGGFSGAAAFQGLNLLDFTPDGNHLAFVAQPAIDFTTDEFYRGYLVTVDLAANARTNWGDVISPFYTTQNGPPNLNAAFLGNTDAAYLISPVAPADNTALFEVSSKDAPTARARLPTPAIDGSSFPAPAISQFVSVDLSESLIRFEGTVLSRGGAPTSTGFWGFAKADKSWVPIASPNPLSFQAATLLPQTPPYGGSARRQWAPEWALLTGTSQALTYKLFGGGAAAVAPLPVSLAAARAWGGPRTVRTADNLELLAVLPSTDGTTGAMVLPLAGATPPPSLLP